MNEVILYLTDYTIKSLVAIILLSLHNSKKRKSFSISISFIIICLSCYLVVHIYNLITFFLVVCGLLVLYIYVANKRKIYLDLLGFLSYMFIYLIENLSYILCLLVSERYGLEINSYYDLLSYIISLVFLGLIIFYINKKDITYWNIDFKRFSVFIIIEFLIILVIVSAINTIYQILFNMNYTFEYYQLMLSLACISIILIIIVSFLCCLFLYLKQIKKELSFQQTYILMEKEYLNILKQHEDDMKKFQHDTNKHLSMLQLLLDNKEYEQLHKYLQELNNNYNKIRRIHKTGNETMDLIINKTIHDNPQITFNLKGDLPEQIAVSQYDLCTILLNLLDNAVEANLKNEDKYIDIFMGYYKDYISIIISNPTENEEVSSYSKKDKSNRGYGIINVKETLTKYEHQFDILHDKQLFKVSILLRYK